MKLELETKLELGTKLYYFVGDLAHSYVKCPICGVVRDRAGKDKRFKNARSCPKCNEAPDTEIWEYEIATAEIKRFSYTKTSEYPDGVWIVSDGSCKILVDALLDSDGCVTAEMHLNEEKALKRLKELNKVENAKKKAFLAENSQIESKEGETEC